MKKFDLFSKYEFEGHWWVAGTSSRCPGKITLSPGAIKLTIFGAGGETESFIKYTSEESPPIFGQAVDGTKFTLLYAFTNEISGHSDKDNSNGYKVVNVIANQCAVGEHILKLQDVIEYDLYINFHGLEEWFRHIPYDHTSSLIDGKYVKQINVRDPNALIDVDVPSLHTSLTSFYSLSTTFGSPTGFASTCTAYLILKSGHRISISDAMARSYDITRLWSLLCGAHISPRFVYFGRLHEHGESVRYDTIHIYATIGDDEQIDRLHPGEFTTYFELMKERVAEVVEIWFKKEERSRAVRGLFFKSYKQQRKRHYDIAQFLNYMSALEIFARERNPQGLLTTSESRKLRTALGAVIKKHVTGKTQDAIIGKLAHLHDPTLREKIKEIASSLGDAVRQNFTIMSDEMISKLVNTRNYYTHYDKKLTNKKKMVPASDLTSVIDQLGVLVMLLLLKELGFDENMVMGRVEQRWLHR